MDPVITYLVGDATLPQVPGHKVIAHICNDIGAWGRGFVLSLTQRFPASEKAYRSWYQENKDPGNPAFKLGEVQFVNVSTELYVANMIGQHGIMTKSTVPPIRYDALERCLKTVKVFANILNASIHMPRIGCGLAGGSWDIIEPIVNRVMAETDVYVYDFTSQDERTIPWKP